jgi:hypothetical protein
MIASLRYHAPQASGIIGFPQFPSPSSPYHDGCYLVVPVAATAGDKIEALRQ